MNNEASEVVVDLAKEFASLVGSLDSAWTKAYYRFRAEELRYGSNASYVSGPAVTLIGAIKHGPFYESMNEKGAELLKHLGKKKGVFLLIVDNKLDYDIKFEWDDLHRWEISKMDGRSGIPDLSA
jgi:predicted regulator of Ras-like GTPase activity (Roadblock/LC7/MglB family)